MTFEFILTQPQGAPMFSFKLVFLSNFRYLYFLFLKIRTGKIFVSFSIYELMSSQTFHFLFSYPSLVLLKNTLAFLQENPSLKNFEGWKTAHAHEFSTFVYCLLIIIIIVVIIIYYHYYHYYYYYYYYYCY